MGICLSSIQRGMDLIFRFLQIRTTNSTENNSHSPNPDGPIDDNIQDDIRIDGVNRVIIEVPRQELTETLLQEYLELERIARKIERKQVLSSWEVKSQLADEAMKTLVQLEARHKELKKQTEKARKDLEHLEHPAIRAHLRQQRIYQNRYDKAKEIFDLALVKEEDSFKELATIKTEYTRLQRVANRHRDKCEKLENTHQRQEEIYCSVNGSSEYMELSQIKELEVAQEWLQRVTLAKFKWITGRSLLIHANIQINYAINSWQELPQTNGVRSRYFIASEARNNFVNSINNIQSCRVYLGRIRFPYVTEEELQSMELVIQNAFNDLHSNIALKKVMTISQGIQDKLISLISWFDKVINQTIIRDLDKANTNVEKLLTQTRELRLELLRKLVYEKLGREINLKELEIENELDKEEEDNKTSNEEEEEEEEEEKKVFENEIDEEKEEIKDLNKEEIIIENEEENEEVKIIDEEIIEEEEEEEIKNKNNYNTKLNNKQFNNKQNFNSSNDFNFVDLYEENDVQRRIRNFENIRYKRINESKNGLQRINNLQEKLRFRRYQLEKRQKEAKILSEQFSKQWKIAINYSSRILNK